MMQVGVLVMHMLLVLKMLVNDEADGVRHYAAGNPNTPPEALKLKTDDPKLPKTSSRKPAKTDWSIPIYSIDEYSKIEDEIDRVIHTAANRVAREAYGTSATADVNSPSGAYDNDLAIKITFHTPDGDEELDVDASDILGPATSRNMKKDCVNQVIDWLYKQMK